MKTIFDDFMHDAILNRGLEKIKGGCLAAPVETCHNEHPDTYEDTNGNGVPDCGETIIML